MPAIGSEAIDGGSGAGGFADAIDRGCGGRPGATRCGVGDSGDTRAGDAAPGAFDPAPGKGPVTGRRKAELGAGAGFADPPGGGGAPAVVGRDASGGGAGRANAEDEPDAAAGALKGGAGGRWAGLALGDAGIGSAGAAAASGCADDGAAACGRDGPLPFPSGGVLCEFTALFPRKRPLSDRR